MKNKYFEYKDSIYNITEKYPETIDLFEAIGLNNLRDEKTRNAILKNMSLEATLNIKKINIENFCERLIEKIEDADNKEVEDYDVKIEGILPCPVRIPLMEAFDKFMDEDGNKLDLKVNANLQSASMGVDFIKESIEKDNDPKNLADIFISAGFDLFFDKNLMGKFKERKVFKDLTGIEKLNSDFDNEKISLKDPDNEYSMIGVVPAVFLVNKQELNGREVPKSFKDILKPEYENSVSLPIGDFDLFNAILLNIYKNYGEDGIKKLGKSLLKSMHPSEMVKSHMKKTNKPLVTIMPYFFTKMIKDEGPMIAVWPEDGAIISPIFMLTKEEKQDKLKPFVDFFMSKEVGEILSHNGKFPSVTPYVENNLENKNFMWLGWDYIKNNDIGSLIKQLEDIFNKEIGGTK